MRTIMAYRYEVKNHEGDGTGRYVSLRLERLDAGELCVTGGWADLSEILDSGVMAELEAVMAAEPMPRDTPEVEAWLKGEKA